MKYWEASNSAILLEFRHLSALGYEYDAIQIPEN